MAESSELPGTPHLKQIDQNRPFLMKNSNKLQGFGPKVLVRKFPGQNT